MPHRLPEPDLRGPLRLLRLFWCVVPVTPAIFKQMIRLGRTVIPIRSLHWGAMLERLRANPKIILKNTRTGELAVTRFLDRNGDRHIRVTQAIRAPSAYRLPPTSRARPEWIISPNLPPALKYLACRLRAVRPLKVTLRREQETKRKAKIVGRRQE